MTEGNNAKASPAPNGDEDYDGHPDSASSPMAEAIVTGLFAIFFCAIAVAAFDGETEMGGRVWMVFAFAGFGLGVVAILNCAFNRRSSTTASR